MSMLFSFYMSHFLTFEKKNNKEIEELLHKIVYCFMRVWIGGSGIHYSLKI